MKRIIGIVCFLCSFCGCSSIVDDLSDHPSDDLTYRLSWIGDTDKFSITQEEGLRLNDETEVGGCAFLATPWPHVQDTRWEFQVHLFFNPSTNNYARFYLVSSSGNLSGALNGYFLEIGGEKDRVSFYRQEGLERTLLAPGRELMKGNNSPQMEIKVECDEQGTWTFWTRLKDEPKYVQEAQVCDVTFKQSSYAGVLCLYTASRCKGFAFSHIQMTEGVETTTKPTEPTEPDKPTPPVDPEEPQPSEKGNLLFNEVMYHPDSKGGEYVELYNNSDTPIRLSGLRLKKQAINGEYLVGETLLDVGGEVPARGYICFTQSAKTLNKHHITNVKVVAIAGFPALNNSGGFLVLQDAAGAVLDRCPFIDAMHTSPKKNNIGVSLEKLSPALFSDETLHWASSQDATGGTPGRENSVTRLNE